MLFRTTWNLEKLVFANFSEIPNNLIPCGRGSAKQKKYFVQRGKNLAPIGGGRTEGRRAKHRSESVAPQSGELAKRCPLGWSRKICRTWGRQS